jgi:hypothetical protein
MKAPPRALRIHLDALSVELPADWEHEMTLISRAPDRDGYRANLRVTCARSADAPSLELLAHDYEARLRQGIAGTVTLLSNRAISVPGGDGAIELAFSAELGGGRRAHHTVLIATSGGAAVTIAASRREGDAGDGEVAGIFERVRASVRFA